jgi:hypothetical protein
MRSEEFISVRDELSIWSQPLVEDIIRAQYRSFYSENSDVFQQMTSLHCKLWRSILIEKVYQSRTFRSELVRLANQSSMDPNDVDNIDLHVIEELMQAAIGRYRHSLNRARDCSLVLAFSLSLLTETKLLAA